MRLDDDLAQDVKTYMGIHKIDQVTEGIRLMLQERKVLAEGWVDSKLFIKTTKHLLNTKFLTPKACQKCLQMRIQPQEALFERLFIH